MSYTITTFDDGHIILKTLHRDFDFANELLQLTNETYALLENGPDFVISIHDISQLHITTLNDLIQWANASNRPEVQHVRKHSKLKGTIIVVQDRVLNFAVKGLNSAAFGFLNIPLFETPDEAVAHARKLLRERSEAVSAEKASAGRF